MQVDVDPDNLDFTGSKIFVAERHATLYLRKEYNPGIELS
jgi:hypothetical protein